MHAPESEKKEEKTTTNNNAFGYLHMDIVCVCVSVMY